MQHTNTTRAAAHTSLASTALGHPIAQAGHHESSVLVEGWVLKKRRKRMQGFARRYFTLHSSGLLSYSFEPGHPTRDQIHLNQGAAISSAPGRKDIHIDSNNATFHIKCLSSQDFNLWMTALRKFIAPDNATLGRRSSLTRSVIRSAQQQRTGALVEELGTTISELQNAFNALVDEEARKKHGASAKFKAERDRIKDHAKEHSGAVLGIFKSRKSGSHNHGHNHTNDHATEDSHSDTTASFILGSPLHRMQVALDALKHQHSALVKSVTSLTPLDTNLPASRGSPLPSTMEEDITPSPSSGYGTIGRSSKRISAFSNHSDGSVWFDAPEFDGAEEFVLDVTPGEEGQGSKFELESPIPATNEDEEDSSDTDTDIEEVETQLQRGKSPSPASSEAMQIVRRTQLPSPPVGDEGSLFAVLKKNVGKDLSQVALPVSFNEPLTLLQRLAEELEYHDLLSEAVKSTDPVERMCYVAAFAVSSYACTRHRSGRKGFNPLLAETYEDVRVKFIAEKVCHNPVVLAYHAEGDGWELYATSSGKTKFWGKSLEIIPQGSIHLKIGEDHFEWTRPSSFMRNLMMGTKYLEHCGKMIIHNTTTSSRCVLEFKESGYWGPCNLVSGTVHSPSGEAQSFLEGKWDEQMVQKLDSSHLRVLWRISSFPRNAPEYYGFTSFGVTLNEITPDLEGKLPPTDSRLRPDVRALEEGDLDIAEEEKRRVEEAQRERRRQAQERSPRWFKPVGDQWQYIGGYWEQRTEGWDNVEPLW